MNRAFEHFYSMMRKKAAGVPAEKMNMNTDYLQRGVNGWDETPTNSVSTTTASTSVPTRTAQSVSYSNGGTAGSNTPVAPQSGGVSTTANPSTSKGYPSQWSTDAAAAYTGGLKPFTERLPEGDYSVDRDGNYVIHSTKEKLNPFMVDTSGMTPQQVRDVDAIRARYVKSYEGRSMNPQPEQNPTEVRPTHIYYYDTQTGRTVPSTNPMIRKYKGRFQPMQGN